VLSIPAFCQQAEPAKTSPPKPEFKRAFWIIPNFRTSPSLAEYNGSTEPRNSGSRIWIHLTARDRRPA
jgi:hypothetical protein